MSYSCTISFKQIPMEDLFGFLSAFKKEVTSHLEDIAKDEYSYCPYIRENNLSDNFPENYRDVPRKDIEMARYWARSTVFQFRYCYDIEHQLLWLFSVPTVVRDLFDCTVYFQNSCDQDYEFDTWNGVKCFEEIAAKWRNASSEDVIQHYSQKYEPGPEDEVSDLDYYRRSLAYAEIWPLVSETLFNDEHVVYLSLYGSYDIGPMNCFIKACHDAEVEWRKENERIYEEMQQGKHPELKRIVDRLFAIAEQDKVKEQEE